METVYQEYEKFQKKGLRVFISEVNLKNEGGSSFFNKINSALQNSKHFVLLCTPEAMDSKWVETEYQSFFATYYIKDPKNRKFFVMKNDNFSNEIVPSLLGSLQFVNNANDIINALKINDPQMKINFLKNKLQSTKLKIRQINLLYKKLKIVKIDIEGKFFKQKERNQVLQNEISKLKSEFRKILKCEKKKCKK